MGEIQIDFSTEGILDNPYIVLGLEILVLIFFVVILVSVIRFFTLRSGRMSEAFKKKVVLITVPKGTDEDKNASKVLKNAVGVEDTKAWMAAAHNLRQEIAAQAKTGTVTKEFINNLIIDKTIGEDIARKLGMRAAEVAGEEKAAMQTILEAVLKNNKNIDEILEAAKNVDFNDAKQATEFFRKFVAPKASEWVDLLRYNSMLSSPLTHIINIFSNLANTALVAPVETMVRGGVDFLSSKITKEGRKYFASEAGPFLKGYFSNIKEASERFASVMAGRQAVTNLDLQHMPVAVSGVKGAIAKTFDYPIKLLEASDQFFLKLTSSAERAAIKHRMAKGVKVNLPDYAAEKAARYRLFRQDLFDENQGKVLDMIDTFTAGVERYRKSNNKLVSIISKLTAPTWLLAD